MASKKNASKAIETVNPTKDHTQLMAQNEALPMMLREVGDSPAKSLEQRLGGLENVLKADYRVTDLKLVEKLTTEIGGDIFTGTAIAYSLWEKKSATYGPLVLKLWECWEAAAKEFNKTATTKKILVGQNHWIKKFFAPDFPAHLQQVGTDEHPGYVKWSMKKQTPLGEIEIRPWYMIQELLRVGRNVRDEETRRLTFLEKKRLEAKELNVAEALPAIAAQVAAVDEKIAELKAEILATDDEAERDELVAQMNEIDKKEKEPLLKTKSELEQVVTAISNLEKGFVPPKETATRAQKRTEADVIKAVTPQLLAVRIQSQQDVHDLMEAQNVVVHSADATTAHTSVKSMIEEYFFAGSKTRSPEEIADCNKAIDYLYNAACNAVNVAVAKAVRAVCQELGDTKRPVFGLHTAEMKQGSDEPYFGAGKAFNDLMIEAGFLVKAAEPKADTATTTASPEAKTETAA
jgi:hypothetical protein